MLELPSADPSADETRIWSDARWTSERRQALLENLRRPWNSSPELGTSRTGLQEGTASFRSSANNWHVVVIRVPIGTGCTYRLGRFPLSCEGRGVGNNRLDGISRARAAELSCKVLTLSRVALSGPPSVYLHCSRQLRAVVPNSD